MSNVKHRLEGESSPCPECISKRTSGARALLTLVGGLTAPLYDVFLQGAPVLLGSMSVVRPRRSVSMPEFGDVAGCDLAIRIAAGGMI